MALAASWPMDSRMEPKMGSSQEQVKLPRCPLSNHLRAPKDVKMEQKLWTLAFVLVLLRRWTLRQSPPFSQIMPHLNKTFFLFDQILPHEFGSCDSRQTKPSFLFGNRKLYIHLLQYLIEQRKTLMTYDI